MSDAKDQLSEEQVKNLAEVRAAAIRKLMGEYGRHLGEFINHKNSHNKREKHYKSLQECEKVLTKKYGRMFTITINTMPLENKQNG